MSILGLFTGGIGWAELLLLLLMLLVVGGVLLGIIGLLIYIAIKVSHKPNQKDKS